jgi:hypothetical protein
MSPFHSIWVHVYINREFERKYHVEDPKKPINEFVYCELEMRCYEIPSNFIAHVK